MKLSVGYRFRPTDEELVVYYLNKKAHSLPLPAQVIPEVNVFQTNLWDLPGDPREKRFFFWKREGKWRKSKGRTEAGCWTAMRKEKHVVSFESNQPIGVKKLFVFYEGKRGPHGLKTQWVMREYRLLGSPQSRPNSPVHEELVREMEMEMDWVVRKIYQKKKWKRNAGEIMTMDMNDSEAPQQSACSSGAYCKGGVSGEINSVLKLNNDTSVNKEG